MREDFTEERAVARSMALLSTLSTAVDVIGAMRERRLGRDPSEQQEPRLVLDSLASELRGLEDDVIALRASLVARDRDDGERVVLVRHMNDLILIGGISRALHRIHQGLMSLYPAVSEDLVEDVRRLQRASDILIEERAGGIEDAIRFADEVAMLAAAIRMETAPIG